MRSLPLELDEGFLFVHLPEGRFLVDTGSPASFGDVPSATFGASPHPIPRSLNGFGMEDVRVLVHGPCAGLLGMDVLGSSRILFDLPGRRIVVGHDAWDDSPAGDRRPVQARVVGGFAITIDVDCGGSRAGVIFDTGSRYCYTMDPALVQHGVKVEDLDDYNPILGRLRSPSWNVDFSIVGDRGPALFHSDRMGLLGGAALGPMAVLGQAFGVSGLVGNRWMSRARIGLDAAAARGNEVLWLAEARAMA